MTARWIRLLVTIFFLASATSCVRLLRQPAVGPRPPDETDRILLRKLDPFLLSDLVTRKVVIEVDWVAGCEPAPKALVGAERFLRRYIPSDIEIVLKKDDEIPRKEWELVLKDDPNERTDKLVEAHLDQEPDPKAGIEVLYVLYTPRSSLKGGWRGDTFGEAKGWLVHRGDRVFYAQGVEIYKEAIRHQGVLWITDARVERNVLTHEMGHELGAVANPRHEWRGNPGHCTNPNCIMTYATRRAIIYNFLPALFAARLPRNFCRDCRADIRRAQELWRARAERDPAFVDGLRARAEAQQLGAEAWDLDLKGDRPGEIAKYREAIALTPDDAWLYDRLAEALRKEKQFDEAIETYREAIRVDPDKSLIFDLGHLLCDRGRYTEVLELVDPEILKREMARNDLDSAYSLLHVRQHALMGTGRNEEVVSLWEEFLRTHGLGDHLKAEGTSQVAAALRREGNFQQAIETYERLPKKSRETADYQTALARLELARGRKSEAGHRLDAAAAMLKAHFEKARSDLRLLLWRDRVIVLALGRKDGETRALLDAVPPHEDWFKVTMAWTRAQALALLGDADGAMQALREVGNGTDSLQIDPCLDEDLAGVRESPRFRELFPWCPRPDRWRFFV